MAQINCSRSAATQKPTMQAPETKALTSTDAATSTAAATDTGAGASLTKPPVDGIERLKERCSALLARFAVIQNKTRSTAGLEAALDVLKAAMARINARLAITPNTGTCMPKCSTNSSNLTTATSKPNELLDDDYFSSDGSGSGVDTTVSAISTPAQNQPTSVRRQRHARDKTTVPPSPVLEESTDSACTNITLAQVKQSENACTKAMDGAGNLLGCTVVAQTRPHCCTKNLNCRPANTSSECGVDEAFHSKWEYKTCVTAWVWSALGAVTPRIDYGFGRITKHTNRLIRKHVVANSGGTDETPIVCKVRPFSQSGDTLVLQVFVDKRSVADPISHSLLQRAVQQSQQTMVLQVMTLAGTQTIEEQKWTFASIAVSEQIKNLDTMTSTPTPGVITSPTSPRPTGGKECVDSPTCRTLNKTACSANIYSAVVAELCPRMCATCKEFAEKDSLNTTLIPSTTSAAAVLANEADESDDGILFKSLDRMQSIIVLGAAGVVLCAGLLLV